jgi:ABC-2 type transport system ATP-binding protein
MTAAVETDRLGKRYGKRWALQDCSLTIPAGRVVGLVGANGAGKTTLLQLVVGLLAPSAGTVEVLGAAAGTADRLARVGFLAQDVPLYSTLTVGDHLKLGRHLNPGWDAALAARRVALLGLDADQRAGQLSGGQRAQLALTLAIAKQPDLLVLDEPVAGLDPLARREFLQFLMDDVVTHELTVILSSHLVSDIERVCDHLVVLASSRVLLSGEVTDLLSEHRIISGPRSSGDDVIGDGLEVISVSSTERQSTLLVRGGDFESLDPSWTVEAVTLEDIVLGYLEQKGRPLLHPTGAVG